MKLFWLNCNLALRLMPHIEAQTRPIHVIPVGGNGKKEFLERSMQVGAKIAQRPALVSSKPNSSRNREKSEICTALLLMYTYCSPNKYAQCPEFPPRKVSDNLRSTVLEKNSVQSGCTHGADLFKIW
jgi:hypothetical protein